MTRIVLGEEWRPVLDYEGLYEVSSAGRVRSVDHWTVMKRKRGDARRLFKGRMLREGIKRGYARVTLFHDGSGREFAIHCLMLEAFVERRPGGMVGRHLNDIGTDNRLGNLAWGTHLDNSSDARRNGRIAWGKNIKCKRGHPLGGWNMIISSGYKKCRSCNLARVSIQGEDVGERSFKDLADSFYARILASSGGSLQIHPRREANVKEAKRLRAQGFTYARIAEILGVSRITADRYVNGRRVA